MNACSGCEPRHMSRVSLRIKELQTGLRLPLGRASSLKARSAMMDRGSASLSKYLREVIDLPVPGFPPWWNEGSPDDGLKGPFQSLEHLTECSKTRKDYSVCLGVFDWHCWSGYTPKWNEMKWNVTVWCLLSKIPYKFKKSEWTELTAILVHIRIRGWT